MINLGVWTPSLAHALKPQLVLEAGISINPVRFGWFVASSQDNPVTDGLDYSVFLNRSNTFYEQYLMDDDQLALLSQDNE